MLNVDAKNLELLLSCASGADCERSNGGSARGRAFPGDSGRVSAVILDFARVTTVDAGGLGVMLACASSWNHKESVSNS